MSTLLTQVTSPVLSSVVLRRAVPSVVAVVVIVVRTVTAPSIVCPIVLSVSSVVSVPLRP